MLAETQKHQSSKKIMRVSLLCNGGNVVSTEVSPESDVSSLLGLASVEARIPIQEVRLMHYGKPLSSGSFTSHNIREDDIINVERARRMNLHDIPGDVKPETLLNLVREHPHLMTQFQSADPEMADTLASNDISKVRGLMMMRSLTNHKAKYDRQQEILQLNSDPYNEENQRRIEEEIRQQNVQSNMELAIEEMPEAFGHIHMLYINCEINGYPVKAFVDSGAQSTIMSVACAERLNLMRVLDKRFAGEARGVGTAKLLGRIHLTQMKLGGSFFPIAITVIENNDVEFLFGLDMLKRHRCIIDLAATCLRVEGSAGVESIPFLSDSEINAMHAERQMKSSSAETQSDAKSSIAPSSAPLPAPQSGGAADEDKLLHLISLGFTDVEAAAALSQAKGNVELAAALLFQNR